MKEKLKDRYNILGFLLIAAVLIIIFKLVNLQIVNGEEYDNESQQRLLTERRVVAPRGNIVDRYGVPIAVNRLGFTVQMVQTKISNAERDAMLLKLVNIFEKNNDAYICSLNKYLTSNPFAFGSENQTEEKVKKWEEDIGLEFGSDSERMDPTAVFRSLRKKYKIDDAYSDEDAYKIVTIRYEIQIRGYGPLNPITLARDISNISVAEIEERHAEFPGVTTEVEPIRKYIDGPLTAHEVGYVGSINAEEYKKYKKDGYGMNDIIGKEGIEFAAEKYLRGKDGLKTVEVNTEGRLTEKLDENPPEPGNNVILTLDMNLQKVAMESLERNIAKIAQTPDPKNHGDANAGAVVAMDVNSGEILAMVSYPTYDPSLFLAGSDNKDAQKAITELFQDSVRTPAVNRAIAGIYAPGSTFKPITAIAGLEEGYITPYTPINDPGIVYYDGMKFMCMEYRDYGYLHGNLILSQALANSCNIYFHELGVREGIDNIDKWSKNFGLGEYTGIDIPGESKGIRSNKAYKKTLTNDIFGKADTAQTSIGQLYNSFTPLQLANYVSALANGGKKYKPHLIKRVEKADGSIVTETVPEYEQIPVKESTIAAVKEGMVAVTNAVDGTAVGAFDDIVVNGVKIKVAGKTGTAETGINDTRSSNALFVCYAPADDPKIAVAVVVERGVWGAYTAPIAHDILKEYFGLNSKIVQDDSIKSDEVAFTR